MTEQKTTVTTQNGLDYQTIAVLFGVLTALLHYLVKKITTGENLSMVEFFSTFFTGTTFIMGFFFVLYGVFQWKWLEPLSQDRSAFVVAGVASIYITGSQLKKTFLELLTGEG